MVLTRRSGALGFALSIALGCVLLVGCDQSLFDANGAVKTGGGDDTMVPTTCPTPCAADAAGDFDGTAGGAGNHWRFLDDHRNRTWKPMTAGGMAMTGADPGNQITTCALRPTAPACKALPDALLMSSAGATSNADPAIEFTAPTAQVLKLSLRAYVASGDDQTIRIYRNSREDVLFTGSATAGTPLEQAVTLDALAGDRFLVALAPTAKGATDVGLQVFVSGSGAVFPSTCQVAVSFSAAAGNTVDNLCGGDFTHALFDGNKDTAPVIAAAGPYAELGSAGDFTADNYYRGTDPLDKSHDLTLQFWVKWRQAVPGYDDAWVFSDLDYNSANSDGLAVTIRNLSPPTLEVAACDTAMPSCWRDIPYPSDGSWQFVRVVQTKGNLDVCLNGVRKTSFPAAAGSLQSTFPPNFGNNHQFLPQGAFFDGELDDVRVFTGALPCN